MAIYTTKALLVNAVVTTTTSQGVTIGDRLIKSIELVRSTGTIGIIHCTFQISNDNSNFVTYNRLISNVGAGTAITTVNLDFRNNSKAFVFIPNGDDFEKIRAVVNFDNGDGNVTATLVGR